MAMPGSASAAAGWVAMGSILGTSIGRPMKVFPGG